MRAQAVKDYLAEQRVTAQRVTAEGKGETQPVTGEDCKKMGAERGSNKKLVACLQPDRRVEIEVLGSRQVAGDSRGGSGCRRDRPASRRSARGDGGGGHPAAAVGRGQLPLAGGGVVAQHEAAAVVDAHLHVAVLGFGPLLEDGDHRQAALAEVEHMRVDCPPRPLRLSTQIFIARSCQAHASN